MRSRNAVHLLPQGTFPIQIDGGHNHVSRYKSYSRMETGLNRQESLSFGALDSPKIQNLAKDRQDLPLPDSRIGAFEPLLYGTIIHADLTFLAYIK